MENNMAHENQTGIRTTEPARGRVAGDGVELAFGYWPGRGAPLVALHGLTASWITFYGLAERLAGRRPVFALDLRGRGDSGKPDGPYGMSQHARDVAAAMRGMELGPSVIVGHSMGAFVATALAAQDPQLVSGLVLLDGGYAPAISAPNSSAGLDAALALRIALLRQTYPSREAYRAFWRTQPHFPASDWNPWIDAFLDYELGGEEPALKPKAAEEAVKADLMEGLHSEQIAERLRSIRVPVLMVRAPAGFVPGQPPLFPDAMMERMRELLPQMEEVLIPDTTHYTMVLGERGASMIAELVHDFAARCSAAPSVELVS